MARRPRQMSKTNPGGGKIAHVTRPVDSDGFHARYELVVAVDETVNLGVLFPNYSVAGIETTGAGDNFAIGGGGIIGMTLDTTTGVLSGTVGATPGVAARLVTFSDKYGLSAVANVRFNVT